MFSADTDSGRRYHRNSTLGGDVYINIDPDEIERGRFGEQG